MELKDEVVRRISPSPAQRREVEKTVEEVLAEVRSHTKKVPYPLGVKLVGSTAKDTYVFPPDLDVFILFPPDVPRSELEKHGLALGRKVLDGEERYAEHPYIHGTFKGFEVDIVPCYSIDDPSELKSAVDRTPFHTDYILSHLERSQRDEVRLLKQFMKGIGAYSAEAKVQGFSGYLVELLILIYGDFEGTLRAAKDWREGLVLTLTEGGGRKFASPMTFYDPVDKERNVASALSLQNMTMFIRASREYLSKPDSHFFFPVPRQDWSQTHIVREIRARGTKLIMVRLPRPGLTEDNLYPQVRRTLEGMQSTLESAGFVVLDRSYSVAGRTIDLIMELQGDRLPAAMKHMGPPVTSEHGAQFLDKWMDAALVRPFIENGRWVAIVKRPHRTAKELLDHEMKKAALGKEMKGLKGMRVFSHAQLLKSGARGSITELLDKTAPWDR